LRGGKNGKRGGATARSTARPWTRSGEGKNTGCSVPRAIFHRPKGGKRGPTRERLDPEGWGGGTRWGGHIWEEGSGKV